MASFGTQAAFACAALAVGIGAVLSSTRQGRGGGLAGAQPNFTPVPGRPGEEQLLVDHGDYIFRVVRYRRTGRLVAWWVGRNRGNGHQAQIFPTELPVSTSSTRSLDQLIPDAARFVDSVRYKRN
jgi:hypothetical protein